MRLVRQELSGRAFALQFPLILQEFGSLIPWLFEAGNLGFLTNGCYFRQRLCQALGCLEHELVPYQLVTGDRGREYYGGLLHFTRSPERFKDASLRSLQTNLETQGASYITCLQVREVKRGVGYGAEAMRRAVSRILEAHPVVWAVCEPYLVSWYERLGAKALNGGNNQDGLAIIAWQKI